MGQVSVDWENPATTVIALLLCGHVLADFLIQPRGMARKKQNSLRVLALHALEVGVVHGFVVLPFSWSLRGLGLVGGIALTHLAIDSVRISLDRSLPKRSLWWFFCDQAAHVGVLLLAWQMWPTTEVAGLTRAIGWGATLLAVVVFNASGGSAIVARTLAALDPPRTKPALDLSQTKGEGPRGAGRNIGILERWMILGLVWAGQWGAVGLVLTAKSIARFKKMDEQAFAEVYLVGTMTSVLVAMVSGALLQLVLR